MRGVSRRRGLLAAILLISISSRAYAGAVNVTITNARNDDGVVRCGLFASADSFRVPGREMRESVGKIQNGKAKCSFGDVPSGTYAVAVFHAERNERVLKTGLFGKPQQGVGFSRNPSITFGPPSFSAAAFKVEAQPVNLQVRLTY